MSDHSEIKEFDGPMCDPQSRFQIGDRVLYLPEGVYATIDGYVWREPIGELPRIAAFLLSYGFQCQATVSVELAEAVMPVREVYERTIVENGPSPEEIAAASLASADPFGIDDPCPMNGGGPHHDIVGCPEIACIHCGRLIWA